MLRLTWRNLVARKVRLVMSTLAIVLGIGFLAGVLTFSHGLGATFDNIIEGSTSDALVRTEGEVYAINDICSHANVSLSEGEVEDCQIECWLHGSSFDLRTGKPSGLPATRPVPVYPVKIEGDDVLVSVTQES